MMTFCVHHKKATSLEAVDRYIKHVNQIRTALRNGVPEEEISQVTGLSIKLVKVYLSLLEKIAESQKKEGHS